MSITIKPADLRSERKIIIQTLLRHLTDQSTDRRFDWLYTASPYGCAKVWLATDENSKTVIGAAAAFPRRFHVGNNVALIWVFGDFCLDAQYRSLGPALQLQRACLSVLETTQCSFCYDFPSASMVAVYKRLGFSMTGKMLRLAKPLRVDRKVKEMVNSPMTRRLVSSVGNTLLKIALPRVDADKSLEVSIHKELCGDEFTALAQEQRGTLGICLQRSAEYLNWRYLNNPLAHHEILTARRRGRLVGYVVWTQAEENASIVDLFGEEDPGMVRCLVAKISALAENRSVMTLSVSINESHPWLSLLSEMGFRVRDSSPVVIIPSKTFAGNIDPQMTGWYLMQGDRDS